MTWLRGLGRKGQLALVFLVALIIVGVSDKAAAAEIGWCVVGLYACFAGSNVGATVAALRGQAPPAPPVEPQEGA